MQPARLHFVTDRHRVWVGLLLRPSVSWSVHLIDLCECQSH